MDIDNILVYLDEYGNPEYVYEVPYAPKNPNYVRIMNNAHEDAKRLELEGEDHEMQQIILDSVYGEDGARFRTPGERFSVAGKNLEGAGRDEGTVGEGDHGEVPAEGEISYQLRDYSSLSEREILAGAAPNTFKNAVRREYLKRYQASLRELEKLKEKLAGYEAAAQKDGVSRTEREANEARAEIARTQVARQEEKLHKLEGQPEFNRALERERRSLAEAVGSMTPEQITKQIERLERGNRQAVDDLLALEMNLGAKRAKNVRRLLEQQQRQKEAFKRTKEGMKDTQSRSKLRDRIKRKVHDLNKLLLNETNYKHVPEELKKAIADFNDLYYFCERYFRKQQFCSLK